MAEASMLCIVCTETVTSTTEAWCGACGNVYHLNQRTDLPGKDCGEVWINEDHMALEFACFRCLHPAPGALDDVLDAAEASIETGLAVAEIEAAAIAGRLAHRRTAGGVYLFIRRDVREFAGLQ
jgi:hypothetical protein